MAYQRDYAREYALAKKRGEVGTGHDGENAIRKRDRRKALKLGLIKANQDLDHKVPLSKGGTESPSNWRGESPHDNRSFYRNSDGSLKRNVPETRMGMLKDKRKE